METIEEIIEQEIAEPLVEESHHTHHRNLRHHHQHHHHHNGSVVMVSTQTGQLVQHQRHEMNNNGWWTESNRFRCAPLKAFVFPFKNSEQLNHQRGRIITHASQSAPGLEMVKQEHCVDVGA